MSKARVVTLSFSAPVELTILMEEYVESRKITRSELIKDAIQEYFKLKKSDNESYEMMSKTYDAVMGVRKLLEDINKEGAKNL